MSTACDALRLYSANLNPLRVTLWRERGLSIANLHILGVCQRFIAAMLHPYRNCDFFPEITRTGVNPEHAATTSAENQKKDIEILNNLLCEEHQALCAYSLASNKLTNNDVGKTALAFKMVQTIIGWSRILLRINTLVY